MNWNVGLTDISERRGVWRLANYAQQYVTTQGDTWDEISLAFYGTPFYQDKIAEQNPGCSNVIRFEAGVKLWIPILDAAPPETLPPWKR